MVHRTDMVADGDSENDVTDVIENSFMVEDDWFGEVITTDLCPDGQNLPVTEENKSEYVLLVTEWRIQRRVEDQFKAFMSGFNELIPQDLIKVFNENELKVRQLCPSWPICRARTLTDTLQLLIGGMSDVDVDDWCKHTDYRVSVLRGYLGGVLCD